MNPLLSSGLMVTSALVIFALGLVHVAFTVRGERLHPRDLALLEAMRAGSLRLTRQTTVWRAWVGFNVSHGAGAMLFGCVFGYLALAAPDVLFQSVFLRALGLSMLAALCVLAHRCWFDVPFRGCVLALLLYVASLASAAVG